MFYYSVIGCKDLSVADSMWYKREGDTVTVGCKDTTMSWSVTCQTGQWTGVIGNCTTKGKYLI